jgi:hypothetical protein
MSTSNLIRWSGLAAVSGSALSPGYCHLDGGQAATLAWGFVGGWRCDLPGRGSCPQWPCPHRRGDLCGGFRLGWHQAVDVSKGAKERYGNSLSKSIRVTGGDTLMKSLDRGGER